MKTTKMMLCGFAAVLLVGAFAACGTGAPARADGDIVNVGLTGDWFTYDDQEEGGTSHIVMTEVEIDGMLAFHLVGELTEVAQWGYAGFGLDPDEATFENLRNTEAISFMVRGDGQRYALEFQTSAVRDYGHFWVIFDAPAEATRVSIPMRNFMQPGWAVPIGRLNQSLVTGIQWAPHGDSVRPGEFELTLWDIRLYVPAAVVAVADPVPAAALEAGYGYEYEMVAPYIYGEYQAY